MKAKIINQKSGGTRYSARYTASFPIALPVEKIDLYRWVTEMTDRDYASYASAHEAMGSYFRDGVFHMVNVENIGNETLVQHYELQFSSPSHVQFYSRNTKALVMRWFPAKVGVPWEMQVRSTSPETSELVCLIGADFPTLLLKIAAWFNGLGGFFLSRHLKREGKAFSKHIETKFK